MCESSFQLRQVMDNALSVTLSFSYLDRYISVVQDSDEALTVGGTTGELDLSQPSIHSYKDTFQ